MDKLKGENMKFGDNLEDIKYIKIEYLDNNETSKTIKAFVKNINEQNIYAKLKIDDEKLQIKIPQDIILNIVAIDGLYTAPSKLKFIEYKEDFAYLTIESPENLEYHQKREYFRIGIEYDCIYIVNKMQIPSKTFDISANGVSIIVPNHVISDENAKLIININDHQIQTEIKYIRSEKIQSGYKLSFMYTKISENDRDKISQACIKYQLEMKKRSIQ